MPSRPITSSLADGAVMLCDTYHRHLICAGPSPAYHSSERGSQNGLGTWNSHFPYDSK